MNGIKSDRLGLADPKRYGRNSRKDGDSARETANVETVRLFGDVDDLIWARRAIVLNCDSTLQAEVSDDQLQNLVRTILECEYGKGREEPEYRKLVAQWTDWFLQRPEIHVPFLIDFMLIRLLLGELVPLEQEIREGGVLTALVGRWKARLLLGATTVVFFLAVIGVYNPIKPMFSFLQASADEIRFWCTIIVVLLLPVTKELCQHWLAWAGPLNWRLTRDFASRVPLLARQLRSVCVWINRGYHAPSVEKKLAELQERGLYVDQNVFELLRLRVLSGRNRFSRHWEEAKLPVPKAVLRSGNGS